MSEQIIYVQTETPGEQSFPVLPNCPKEVPAQHNQVIIPPINNNGQQMPQPNPYMNYGNPYNNYGGPQNYQGNLPNSQPPNYYAPPYNYNPNIPIQNPQWMPRPEVIGCPPGLEYLTQIDQLLIHQKVELTELLTGFETNNRYSIKNVFGQVVYYAKEDTDCCLRYFCGPNRPFVIHICDNLNQEVIQIRRPYTCNCVGQCLSCSSCCQDEVIVEAPAGNIVGFVKQLYEGCEVRYSILNANKEIVLRLHGPNYFHCYCPGDDFPLILLSADCSTVVGKVSKQWTNLIKEYFTDADNFGIQFPMDLDVKIKAVIIGSVFLLDFMYFERQKSNNRY